MQNHPPQRQDDGDLQQSQTQATAGIKLAKRMEHSAKHGNMPCAMCSA
jgi:hypothetical protein